MGEIDGGMLRCGFASGRLDLALQALRPWYRDRNGDEGIHGSDFWP